MAAPTLQAQGTIAASTNGLPLTVTIPTYAANDIIVINYFIFAPNTSQVGFDYSLALPETTQWYGFTNSSPQVVVDPGDGLSRHAIAWARATSASSLGTVQITPGTSWDTGADTCLAARAYVFRGCDPSAGPSDSPAVFTTPSTAANPQLPSVTVYDTERLVVHFMSKMDNTTLPTAATGYTVGTVATTTTGTDGGFQTYRQTSNGGTISAVTPTGGTAPATGGSSAYFTVIFRPNNPRRVLIT